MPLRMFFVSPIHYQLEAISFPVTVHIAYIIYLYVPTAWNKAPAKWPQNKFQKCRPLVPAGFMEREDRTITLGCDYTGSGYTPVRFHTCWYFVRVVCMDYRYIIPPISRLHTFRAATLAIRHIAIRWMEWKCNKIQKRGSHVINFAINLMHFFNFISISSIVLQFVI